MVVAQVKLLQVNFLTSLPVSTFPLLIREFLGQLSHKEHEPQAIGSLEQILIFHLGSKNLVDTLILF